MEFFSQSSRALSESDSRCEGLETQIKDLGSQLVSAQESCEQRSAEVKAEVSLSLRWFAKLMRLLNCVILQKMFITFVARWHNCMNSKLKKKLCKRQCF